MIATCAEICQQSYDDAAVGWTYVEDLRYGVFEKAGHTIIAIRGTANAENWLRDASAWPKKSCGGYLAHGGFVDAYRKLCSGGMPTVKGDNIVATGHSLGGAIATLLAEHIGCKVITFGSPRVYAKLFSAPTLEHTRIICDDDVVPRVPAIFYRHTVKPAYVLKDGDCQLISFKDHSISVYAKRLPAALTRSLT